MTERIRIRSFVATEDIDYDETHTLDASGRYVTITRTAISHKMVRTFVWSSPTVNTIISSPPPVITDLP